MLFSKDEPLPRSAMASKRPPLQLHFTGQGAEKVLPLSIENVASVFRTGDLTKNDMFEIPLGRWLYIPDEHHDNPLSAATWWVNQGRTRAWKTIIYYLDRVGETGLADELMPYSEPPSDSAMTVERVTPIFMNTRKWTGPTPPDHSGCILFSPVISDARAAIICHHHQADNAQRRQAAVYYVKVYPWASWGQLAAVLYRCKEKRAIEVFKAQLPKPKDPTLTKENMMSATEGVEMPESRDDKIFYLDMRDERFEDIVRRHGSGEEGKRALFSEFLSHHPYPTWEVVVKLLERLEVKRKARVGLAKEVKEKYLTMPQKKALAAMSHALDSRGLKQRDLITMLVGITGSGKSTLLCRLFEEEPPRMYSSTGVTKQPFRGLLHRVSQIGSWKRASHDHILQFLAPLLLAGVPEDRILSLAKTFTPGQVEPTHDSSEDTFSDSDDCSEGTLSDSDDSLEETLFHSQSQVSSSPPSQEGAASSSPSQFHTTVALTEKSHAKEVMLHHLRHSSVSEKHTTLELLHVVDTGGQPEFMEVMPFLIHNAHIIALVVNLAQSFDDHTQMAFHEDGKKYKHDHPFLLSNREVILQLVRTMQAKRAKNESQHFKIIIIGTHRDKLWFKSKATIAAANMELRTIFLPAFRKELIVYRSDNEILFPVNSYRPNRDDKAILDEIRQKISDPSLGKVIDIPPSFFMFEQDTISYAKQQGRGIVSFDECVAVGSLLKMDQEIVLKALNYFHEHNIFLYLPDILPDLAFTDPQVPLNFINMVVAFSYKVLHGGFRGLPAEYALSLKNAVITKEMFQHESLAKCFVPNLYEPQHATELFTHLGVIAPLHEDKSETSHQRSPTKTKDSEQPRPKPSGKEKYLMPCLLKDLTESDIKRFIPHTPVAVFVVRFSDDCVPTGTFGGSLSRFLTDHGWKICQKEDGTPQCLAHNIVTIHDPKLPATITYVNATRHFELHVECVNADDFRSIFPRIRNTMFSTIHTTFKRMQFAGVTIEDAFLCNCDLSESISHAATLHNVDQKFFLQCTKVTGFKYPVNKSHEVWIQGQDGGSKDQQRPTLIEFTSFKTTSGDINVADQIGTKYETFGIQLLEDVTGAITDAMKRECLLNAADTNIKIFRTWLMGKGRKPLTWATLIEVLRKIELSTLASDIEQNLQVSA